MGRDDSREAGIVERRERQATTGVLSSRAYRQPGDGCRKGEMQMNETRRGPRENAAAEEGKRVETEAKKASRRRRSKGRKDFPERREWMEKVTGRPAFVEENLSGRTYVEWCDDGGAIKGRSGGQKGKSAIRLEERREKGGIPGGRRCG